MKSLNFEILRDGWPELAGLGGFAESYAHADPASALVKLRLFAENLTKDIYRALRLPKPDQPTFVDLLKNDAFIAITPKVVLDKLHALRMHGNKAAHGDPVRPQHALWLLKEAHDLARWMCVRYGEAKADQLPSFEQPTTPGTVEERERRQILEKLAAQEAQMDALLSDLEEARSKASTAVKEAAELKQLAKSAQAAADELQFSEAETRARLIDSMLASVGWDVAEGVKNTTQVGKEIEVDGQPTTTGTGYADYVLWDDNGNPLAVIEAKKTSVDAELGRHQAKLYADSLHKRFGHRPVIFYTNGFDIWIWDDAQDFPPRKLYGFYSKDSLQHLANYQRHQKKPLDTVEISEQIVDRLYQLEAIKRVSERFSQKHRRALVVQATGTGKTRVAIALTDLLIRAGWVKRVLFLCDRKELRKQAKNAFNDFLSEPRVHFRDHDSRPSPEVLARDGSARVGGLLPPGYRIELYSWSARQGGEDFHDRYVLSDLGGIMIGAGLSADGSGESAAFTLLNFEHAQGLRSRFASGSTVYTRVGSAVRIRDDGGAELF